MEPQSAEDISRTIINQTVFNRFKTDNVLIQSLFSFIAISLVGLLTAKLTSIWEKIQEYIKSILYPDEEEVNIIYPQLKFQFTKKRHTVSLNGVTTAVLAWIEKLKESLSTYNTTLKHLKNCALFTGDDYNDGVEYYEDHWIPDQSKEFLIQNNVYIKFESENVEETKEAPLVEAFTMYIYIKDDSADALKKLLEIHKDVVDKYNYKLKSKYETKPHIFQYKEFADEEIEWEINTFSSTRELKHIWFDEKNTFVNAYENFLFNKKEYEERGDPYTFSILLYGPPGCGKTSILKSLVNYDIKREITSHLFIVPFSKVDNIEIFKKIMLDVEVNGTKIPMDRRIYVFEDFDANDNASVFDIRKGVNNNNFNNYNNPNMMMMMNPNMPYGMNGVPMMQPNQHQNGLNINKKNIIETKKNDDNNENDDDDNDSKTDDGSVVKMNQQNMNMHKLLKTTNLHLSDVLNILDGLFERTGQRCIWTTNKSPPQDYFDPAFLRPGRMDMIIKLGKCSIIGIKYLLKIYFKYDDMDKLDFKNIDENKFTPAQIKQICKEASNINNAIQIMREICEKDKLNKLNDILQPTKIIRLHSGHGFKSPQINNENDINKIQTVKTETMPFVKTKI